MTLYDVCQTWRRGEKKPRIKNMRIEEIQEYARTRFGFKVIELDDMLYRPFCNECWDGHRKGYHS